MSETETERKKYLCGGYCTGVSGPGGLKCTCARGNSIPRPVEPPEAKAEAWADLFEPSAERLMCRAAVWQRLARLIDATSSFQYVQDAIDKDALISVIYKAIGNLEREAQRIGRYGNKEPGT